MKWNKLGRIFNPVEHSLPNNCAEFAQSPQTLVFDDFVRIYFSTREKDKGGKYLSHISYIEVDKQFSKILKVSSETVIPLGELGCFDEHGIFPMNVLKMEDRILAFTTGWNRRVSVSADASIGLALSYDGGISFTKSGNGPLLTASLNEPFLVCDAFVNVFEGVFHMWYIYGTKWINDPVENIPQRVYKIVHAISNDGLNWEREGVQIVPDKLHENECQALPSVICHNNMYHMYFCYRDVFGFRKDKAKAYRIGYAYSYDLKNWIRDDLQGGMDVTENEWDSDMQCYPHIFHCDNKVYMLYNGNEFGRYGFGLAELIT